MKKVYFTVTGAGYCFEQDILKQGMKVTLRKDPSNKHDNEAIEVRLPGIGKVGYVANSVHTVLGECWSGGRIYDKIGDEAEAEIMYVIKNGSAIGCLEIENN